MPQPWTPRTRPPLLGKRADAFPTPSTAVHETRESKRNNPRLRAGKESDDTHATYRAAAFQTFLSGRIWTFGDSCRVHPDVGCCVTFTCKMRRRSWARTTKTNRSWQVSVGTAKKSTETVEPRWFVKVRQL